MLLNKQAVRQMAAERGKQTSGDFVEALNRKVQMLVDKAIVNTGGVKRLSAKDLE